MTSIAPESSRKSQKKAGDTVVGADVRDAVRVWAEGIRGAPRNLDDMVVLLKEEEEVILRVATELHRREVVEERGPADRSRRPTARRTDPRTIDPWTLSPADLRLVTEDVDTCVGCGGRGGAACAACSGSGAAPCTTCGGATATPGSPPCPLCRGGGKLACGVCAGRGGGPCGGCGGSGVQLVWLTYAETTRVDVSIVPQSPLLALHEQLAEPRILAKSDLAPFTILAAAMAQGGIPSSALAYDEYERLQERAPPVDRRQDRVGQQQYLRFAAVRRELAYDMCGVRARLVLSGASCAVETTPESLVPIHRRMIAWSIASFCIVMAGVIAAAVLFGPTSYFLKANAIVALLMALSVLFASGFVAGFLRILGPRLKLGRFTMLEKIAAIGMFLPLGGIVAVKVFTRPSAAEAREYLAAGNAPKTELCIAALEATNTEPTEVAALKDDVAYVAAQALKGDDRLAKLDQIAAAGGARAVAAENEARQERIERVRALLAERKTTDALDLIAKLFGGGDVHPEIRDLRGAVHDVELEQCATDPCRFIAARRAEREMPTPAREARVNDFRVKLSDSISGSDIPGESVLARLRRLRTLEATAQSIAAVATADDAELVGRAKAAGKWAAEQREKVPLLGADEATLAELLGVLDEKMHVTFQGVAVYLSMDKSRRCNGIYVVGETRDARKQGLKSEYLPAIILSKALGRPAMLHKPGDESSTKASWTEDGHPVVARFREGTFAELSVGDAVSGAAVSKPRPLGPAKLPLLSLVAFPGGEIFVDGVSAGRDATAPMKLKLGKHEIKIKNRVLGENVENLEIRDTDPSVVTLVW